MIPIKDRIERVIGGDLAILHRELRSRRAQERVDLGLSVCSTPSNSYILYVMVLEEAYLLDCTRLLYMALQYRTVSFHRTGHTVKASHSACRKY